MKINWRRIGKWSVILTLLGILSVLTLAWFIGGSLVSPANRKVGIPPADFPATSISFQSESGTTISGWYHTALDSVATVILLHPNRSDRRSMVSRAKLFQKHGYSTLMIDLQAHGESKGENITVGFLEKHDVRAAVDFVRKADSKQKIAIVGRSLGGASTVFANPEVDVIVLESVYPTVTEAVHNRVKMRMGFLHHLLAPLLLAQLEPRLGISPDQLCPIDEIPNIRCPILVASGDKDRHTTIGETEQLFQAANQPKKLVIFQDAQHVDLFAHNPSKYENEIVGYVNRIIGNPVFDKD